MGKSNGWPGEKWLDIRRPELTPILDARVAKCSSAGFDAVEFDNVDGYTNSTGFPLTAADQLTFDQGLAAMAHGHNLSVGLKNDLGQLGQLQNDFDFAINEQCFQYDECDTYNGWLVAGKAVVEVEYKGNNKKICADAIANDRDAIHKSFEPEGEALHALSLTARIPRRAPISGRPSRGERCGRPEQCIPILPEARFGIGAKVRRDDERRLAPCSGFRPRGVMGGSVTASC